MSMVPIPGEKNLFYDTVSKIVYERQENVDMNPISTGGAAHVTDAGFANGPVYTDGTYEYYGKALPGTALTAASWQVKRLNLSTSQVQFADGDSNPDNVFTSLAIVAALSYS